MSCVASSRSLTAPWPSRIVGVSHALRDAVMLAFQFAGTDVPVLLTGETGTGKELLAQEIHRWSGRRGALVDVNCGALPREMIESLLFGHRRGAFTGAHEASAGLIEAAGDGTLFLDELCSLPREGQSKLLRVLEGGEYRRVGETVKRQARFRTIAAINTGVRELLASAQLRPDLYQRLAGVIVQLPPLRERPEDLMPLASHFAAESDYQLAATCEGALRDHSWPGNVRELRATILRAAVMCDTPTISSTVLVRAVDHTSHSMVGSGDAPLCSVLSRASLESLCQSHGWSIERLAQAMGVSRATLYRRLKSAGLSRPRVSHVSEGLMRQGET